MEDKACLEKFEAYLRDVKKSSNNTLASYMRDVRQLGDYLATHTDATLASAEEEEVAD